MQLACLLFVVLSVRANVVVRPEAQHFRSPGSADVKCFFSTPLTECSVRISEHYYNYFDSLRNMSSGSLSPRVAMHDKYHSSYAGNGLDPGGECGVKVDVGSTDSVMLVECFGRTVEGEWGRGIGTITTDIAKVLPVNFVSPRLVLATTGTNVAVLLKADRRLSGCYVTTHSIMGGVHLSPGNTPPTGSRYVQHGAGPANRECGFELTNVQETDSGVWNTLAWDSSSRPTHGFRQAAVVLVTVAPVGLPVLKTNDTQSSKIGDMIQATCHTPAAVPAPNIIWLLGGHVVRHDELNTTLPGDVGKSRPWQRQPRHQTFTHRLTTEDNGKRLECRMEHVTLASPLTVGHLLAFVDSPPTTIPTTATPTSTPRPIRVDAEQAIIRTAEGHLAELVCIVDAVPAATVQWRQAGVTVNASDLVVIGNDGDRFWVRLYEVTANDMTNYSCTASNGHGSASQNIQITGVPGTPQFSDNASPSQLTWRVETAVPLTRHQLKIWRGKRPWVEFSDIEMAEAEEEGWQLVTLKQLPVLAGSYSSILKVENKFGWSERSPIHQFTIVSVPTTATNATTATTKTTETEATTATTAATTATTATIATTKTTETEATTPIAPVASYGVKRPVAPSLTESCGLALAGDVGGSNEAVLGQFPWHAAIFGKYETGLGLLCAATLISRRHLLTAAHCVCDINSELAFEADSLLVALGSTTRTVANDSTAQLMAVESVHINRWFRGAYPYSSDLAVLRLREEVQESDTVRRACVDWRNTMKQEDLREGRTGQLATWGAVNQSSLRWLNLTYSPESACLEKLEEDNLLFRYLPDTLCAEFFEEREHCAEDAGAGLVFKNATTQRHYVRGVAGLPFSRYRYERGCDFKNCLTGFTRLSAHLDWLEAIVLAD